MPISSSVWKELLQDIQERAEGILLFVSDAILSSIYSEAKYQTCCVFYLQRNISHKVRISDCQEICDDFKTVYRAENLEMHRKRSKISLKKWKAVYQSYQTISCNSIWRSLD
ncbi:transposase [Peribacillus simplex]|uniref:transposase n=1 Tax=Peribacillus simplex TaxID=1478 RepID=UPI003D277258